MKSFCALIQECRALVENASFSDEELVMMHTLTMFKPYARAYNLERFGMRYSVDDPLLQSLIAKKMVKVQGKSIIPDRDKIKAELIKHEVPVQYQFKLTNPCLSFKC